MSWEEAKAWLVVLAIAVVLELAMAAVATQVPGFWGDGAGGPERSSAPNQELQMHPHWNSVGSGQPHGAASCDPALRTARDFVTPVKGSR